MRYSNGTDLVWREFAACRGLDPEMFYPDRGEDPVAAREVCRSCAVQTVCLEFALAHREKTGVWGGTSERERSRIARRRAQQLRREREAGTLSA